MTPKANDDQDHWRDIIFFLARQQKGSNGRQMLDNLEHYLKAQLAHSDSILRTPPLLEKADVERFEEQLNEVLDLHAGITRQFEDGNHENIREVGQTDWEMHLTYIRASELNPDRMGALTNIGIHFESIEKKREFLSTLMTHAKTPNMASKLEAYIAAQSENRPMDDISCFLQPPGDGIILNANTPDTHDIAIEALTSGDPIRRLSDMLSAKGREPYVDANTPLRSDGQIIKNAPAECNTIVLMNAALIATDAIKTCPKKEMSKTFRALRDQLGKERSEWSPMQQNQRDFRRMRDWVDQTIELLDKVEITLRPESRKRYIF